MKRTMKLAAGFALALGGLTTGAGAATDAGLFAARGIGARTCGDLAAASNEQQVAALRMELAAWIAGYMSSVNRTSGQTFDAIPVQNVQALAELTRGICANNTDKLVENVFSALVNGFAALALAGQSEMTTLRNDKYQVAVRADTLTAVQNFLVANSYLDAKFADGQYGPKTATALKAFQEKRKIVQTGVPDAMTLFLIAEALKAN